MRLGDKQKLFTRLVAKLLIKAHKLGYEVTFGDAYRDPRSHGKLGVRTSYGRRYSVHKLRLAIDLNLFKDGRYLTKTEDHRPLGEWWERQHESCCWGGRFNDGNHYSMEHDGLK